MNINPNAAPTRKHFIPVAQSLRSLAGEGYACAVARARSALTSRQPELLASEAQGPDAHALLDEVIDFYPADMAARLAALLPQVGRRVVEPLPSSSPGATTARFEAATRAAAAPLAGLGYYRVGEGGRLYLLAKSEHYHAPLGHAFPGYRLIDNARRLGLCNATHNNTRGHLTRVLEQELVAAAGGGVDGRLDRVLNLETGSLAMEAAIKLALACFYPAQADSPAPRYAGRTPVMLVLADDQGGIQANYHGTTLFAQTMRGMWQPILDRFEQHGILRVRAVRPNDIAGLKAAFARWDAGEHKIAGLFCELVLMNYGARVLTMPFVRRAEELCRRHDAPLVVDEIQTGIWSPRLLMFHEYGIRPDMVALGKGFPGGEYPASRLLLSRDLDTLPQFGALVTNGQEELASLAYLITMRWAEANAGVTASIGEYYEQRLRDLADRHRSVLVGVEGRRHMLALHFHDLPVARAVAGHLNDQGIDISVQTYKTSCPPAALTKLPLIAGYEVVDFLVERIAQALRQAQASP